MTLDSQMTLALLQELLLALRANDIVAIYLSRKTTQTHFITSQGGVFID